jgi:hypothetical protein
MKFDKGAGRRGHRLLSTITPACLFRSYVFPHIARPAFRSVENDDTKRVVELPGQEAINHNATAGQKRTAGERNRGGKGRLLLTV